MTREHSLFPFFFSLSLSLSSPTATLNNGRRPWKFIEDEREAGVQLVFPHAEECGGYQSVVGEFNFVTHRKECRRPLPSHPLFSSNFHPPGWNPPRHAGKKEEKEARRERREEKEEGKRGGRSSFENRIWKLNGHRLWDRSIDRVLPSTYLSTTRRLLSQACVFTLNFSCQRARTPAWYRRMFSKWKFQRKISKYSL